MEQLFKSSPTELSKNCINAEFDKKNQLIIDTENCVCENNITFFKKPIRIRFGVLQTSILDKTAIVKEDTDCAFLFLFALAETAKYKETLREFYDTNHCDQYNCFGLDGYYTGWEESEYLHPLEVYDE